MKYFKPANRLDFDKEDFIKALMSLSDQDIKQLRVLAEKYGLTQDQINEGLDIIRKLRRQ